MSTYKDTLMLVDKVTKPLANINEKLAAMEAKTEEARNKFQKFNDRINVLSQRSQKAISVIGTLTKSFIGLVGASGVITMGINRAAQYGDKIDKMSQKIGMSQKAFQEWDYIMSQNGGSVETLQMGFKTLTTQIEGVQKGSKDSINAFKALGINVKTSTGQLKNQDEIFNETVRALQKIENPTKKAMLANRLFGRSAAELRPLLNQSADSIDNLRNKANKLGLIMSPEDVKNAVEFTDTMDTLGRFFQARINAAVTKIMPKLVKTFEKLMEYKAPIEAIFKGLAKVAEITFKIMGFLGKHWEILVGIGAALAALAAPAIYASIVAGIGIIAAAITSGALAANVALAGIPLLIGLLVTGITMLITHWDKVKDAGKSVCQAIASAWGGLVNKFQEWFSKIMGWVNGLLEKLGFLAYLIPGLNAIKIGKNIFNALTGSSGNTTNNNSVCQNSTSNTTTNTYNTTNYYGNIIPTSNMNLGSLISSANYAI